MRTEQHADESSFSTTRSHSIDSSRVIYLLNTCRRTVPMAFSSPAPTLIIPDEKSTDDTHGSYSFPASILPAFADETSSNGRTTKRLTRMLSTQSSFDRQHPPHPIAKRFSIDADPSSIISNTPVSDLSNHPSRQLSTSDADETSFAVLSSTNVAGKDVSPARSPLLKKTDSFLEIPYEKAEIIDLIKFADDPNSAAYMTSDGQEVLLEHGAATQ